MPNQPRQAFLVSHTHWDREWYLTFNRFRVNLVEVVRRVLDRLETDPHFKHFVLDGQTCILEDYLQVVPEDTGRIRKLIASGALAVGPWYILPDEFLVSGEATVRNLVMGRKVCQKLGRVQKVGYMPDTFGHVAQMPQILRLAGIDSFIFTRGLGDEAKELGWVFQWAAPDTTQVLAINQCDGYCNAGGLGHAELWHAHTQRDIDLDQAVEKIQKLIEKMDERPGTSPLLINNGCDHFPPQKDLGKVIDHLNENLPEIHFEQTRLEDFLKAARAQCDDDDRPQWEGEMLGGLDHLILSGVWSTRMYLKQQNEVCQNLLTRVVEPFCAMTSFCQNDPWPTGLLDESWRELLRNHPHDSICGCSTDSVHKDMETRFAAVIQTGEQILAKTLDRLSPLFARQEKDDRQQVLTVVNTLPFERDEVVERLVVLPPLDYDLDNLQLVDETGQAVAFHILEKRFLERFWGVDYRSEIECVNQVDTLDTYLNRFGSRIIGSEKDRATHDCFLLIQFLAKDLPAVGYRHYHIVDKIEKVRNSPSAFQPARALRQDDSVILENQHLRVRLHPDGTFDLKDLATDHSFNGLNLLEDTEDTGDEYDFCPAETSLTVFSAGCEGKLRITGNTDLVATAETTFRFDLPRSLEKDRQSRFPRTTPCDVTVRLVLHSGSRRVEVETSFNNRAFDHRLRAWFPTGLITDEVTSDGHFMLNHRPIERPSGDHWAQPTTRTWPQQDWSALQDAHMGLAIFNRGLPEFETWADGDRGTVFALTLLRCVDWLSRDDLATRKNTNAGPTLFTPDAQCIGRHVFRYGVSPFRGDVLEVDIPGQSEAFRARPLTHQGVADQMRPGGISLVRKTDPRVNLTAIKKSEHGDFLEIRLANLSGDEVSEILEFGLMVVDADKTNLLGGDVDIENEEVFVSDGGEKIKVPLEPYEIATIAVELEKP